MKQAEIPKDNTTIIAIAVLAFIVGGYVGAEFMWRVSLEAISEMVSEGTMTITAKPAK